MNGVRGVSGPSGGTRLQGQAVQRGNRFTVPEPAIEAGHAVIASASIAGLIALQDEAAPARRNQAARRNGEAMLDDLSRLQAAFLGAQAPGAVSALRQALAASPQAADPQLNHILASIRLRARIELAKRGH